MNRMMTACLVAILLALGTATAFCFKKAVAPGSHGLSFAAVILPLALGTFFAGGWLFRHAISPGAMGDLAAVTLGALLFLGAIVSIILGIIALEDFSPDKGHRRGRAYAGTGIALSGLALALLTTMVSVAVAHRHLLDPETGPRATHTGSGKKGKGRRTITHEALNYRYDFPGRPWVELEAQQHHPEASFLMTRQRPEIYFMIIAETLIPEHGMSEASLIDLVQANGRSVADEIRFSAPQPRTVNGIEGRTFEAKAEIQAQSLHFRYWVALHRHGAYQLILWGPKRNARAINKAYPKLLDRFHLLDPNRPRVADRPRKRRLASENFGYALPLEGTGWQPWDTLAEDVPDADDGALLGQTGAIVSVCQLLGDLNPTDRLLAELLLPTLDYEYQGDEITRATPFTRGQATGHSFTVRRQSDGLVYQGHIDVLQVEGLGLMVGGWALASEPERVARIRSALDRLEITGPAPGAAEALPAGERALHAQGLNSLGLQLIQASNTREALGYFKQAAAWDPENDQFAYNAADTYHLLGAHEAGIAWLEPRLGRYPESRRLKANLAYLLGQAGQLARSAALYEEVFATDFEEADYYTDYLDTLVRLDLAETALADLDARLERAPKRSLQLLKADVLGAIEAHGRAIAWLEDLETGRAFDADVVFRLAENKIGAGRAREAVEHLDTLLDRGHDTAYTWTLLGQAHAKRRAWQEAEHAFEQALARSPHETSIQEALQAVRAQRPAGPASPSE